MLYEFEKLDDQIKAMKQMSILLIPYSQPRVSDDDDVSFFKQREIIVDGYRIIANFSHSDYEGIYLDVISFTGKYMPYLPMILLCKLGERFLGNKELTFNESLRNGRKFYSWMVLYKADGTPVSNNFVSDGIEDSFNGLEFTRCSTKQEIQTPPI